MRISQLVELQQRLARQLALLDRHAGAGIDYSVEVPDYGKCRYVIPGVISHEEFVDRVENAVHWVHVIKDHLKLRFEAAGGDPQVVEQYIDANRSLALCVDLDNKTKHGQLTRRTRTGTVPQYGTCQLSSGNLIENGNLKAILRGVGVVGIEFNDPDLVEYTLPILDGAGVEIGEAGQTVATATRAWENLLAFIDGASEKAEPARNSAERSPSRASSSNVIPDAAVDEHKAAATQRAYTSVISAGDHRAMKQFCGLCDQLAQARFFRVYPTLDHKISFNADAGPEGKFAATTYDLEDLRSFLVFFRRLVLEKEPTYIYRILGILGKYARAEFRPILKEIKAAFKSAEDSTGGLQLKIGPPGHQRDFSPVLIRDLYFNAGLFHDDESAEGDRALLRDFEPAVVVVLVRYVVLTTIYGLRVAAAIREGGFLDGNSGQPESSPEGA